MSNAIVSAPTHSNILASNLETSEKDSVELEKRLKVNEERERELKKQLQIHYNDLKIAANPTTRVQLERGIESIQKELRLLRNASNKFLNKLRKIADGLDGMERNKFIREHRLEERVGNELEEQDELKKSVEIEGKKNKDRIKVGSLMAVEKHLKKTAKKESKKAVKAAKKIYGNDKHKLNQIKEETEKGVYKKSYKKIVNELKKSGSVGKEEIKNKAEGIAYDLTKPYEVESDINAMESNLVISNIVNKALGKPSLSKSQIDKIISKRREQEKEKQKLKEAAEKKRKEIEKQKYKEKKLKLKLKLEKEKNEKKGIKSIKKSINEKDVHPYKIKRHIQKRIKLIEDKAKEDGIEQLKPVDRKIKKKLNKLPTSRDEELKATKLEAVATTNELEGMRQAQKIADKNMKFTLNREDQMSYMREITGGFVPSNYYIDPKAIDAEYEAELH